MLELHARLLRWVRADRRRIVAATAVIGGGLALSAALMLPSLFRAGGGDPEGDRPRFDLERYPTLEAPPRVEPEGRFAVLVSLTREELTPAVNATPTLFSFFAPPPWTIDVVLSAPGFDFGPEGNLGSVVMEPERDSTVARFDLVAPAAGTLPNGGRIWATFFHEGSFLARAGRPIEVRSSPASAADSASGSVPSPGASPGQPDRAPAGLSLGRPPPDLTLTIQGGSATVASAGWRLAAGRVPAWTENDRRALAERLGRLAAASRSRHARPEEERPDAAALARALGLELWERWAPPVFRERYWQRLDAGEPIETLQINTDDPSVPWELMKPWRNGPDEERPFLGLEVQIARLHLDADRWLAVRSPGALVVEEVVVLRPEYEEPLEGARDEAEFLQALGLAPTTLLPSRYASLVSLSGDLPRGILHFAGHGIATRAVAAVEGSGAATVDYSILLEDRRVTLEEWKGLLPVRPAASHPLVVFNACDVGAAGTTFGFADGWPPIMLQAGASGYVGALWPVSDEAASRFSRRFYESLSRGLAGDGGSVAASLRAARRLYLEDPDPTYLAYVLYGDTGLRLVRPVS